MQPAIERAGGPRTDGPAARFCFRSPSPEATRSAAGLLARAAAGQRLVIALDGALGAGKTVFVKGLAAGLGLDPALVTSPTFVIACELDAPDGRRLAHLDLYRLERVEELESAGFQDCLEGADLVAIEWAERFPGALPDDRLAVRIVRAPARAEGEPARDIEMEATGPSSAAVLERAAGALVDLEELETPEWR